VVRVNEWPAGITVGSIKTWPGALTPEWKRKPSAFGATLTTTLVQMRREVSAITETAAQRSSVELLVAIPPEQFRTTDGMPRARAVASHPGIILSLDSKHGHLSYPCDTFTTWQDNLRAVVLALESLRRVDRYGVTRHGEQYRGFAAIEASGFTSVDAAFAVLEEVLGFRISREHPSEAASAVRVAKRQTHPDVTGDPVSVNAWHRVVEAERVLREAGRL
jgi:hypothetical protein